ncbi:MAG TPA: hypothetical protein VEY67_00620 [Candidatus Dormibacteraeota bacterium]|nr:hypothetical protein [Candidatus Dormibacteraeota bacterium]
MATIHWALGIATLALAVASLVSAAASALLGTRMPPTARAWLVDGLALVVEGLVVVTALGGPLLLATGHQPADVLHFLYAVVAAMALPVALGVALARGAQGPRRDRWLALGALVLVGVAVRLIQTG